MSVPRHLCPAPTSRLDASPPRTATRAFARGFAAGLTSVLSLVLFGTYTGIGSLAHQLGFGLSWVLASTLLVWAAPAQVILISALGAGSPPFEAAIAVGLSGIRLLPMVVALLPLLGRARQNLRALLLPAHFTAVSVWVEALRLLPAVDRAHRIAFCNGLGCGFLTCAMTATATGFYLAAQLPALFAAALLFLTPVSFLLAVLRNSALLIDRLALALGLIIGPLLAFARVELDLLWTGIAAGTLAYAVHRLKGAFARPP